MQRQKKNFHKSVRFDVIYSFWRKLWVMWTSCLVFYIHPEKGCLEQYFLSMDMVGQRFCVNVVKITDIFLLAFAEIYVVFVLKICNNICVFVYFCLERRILCMSWRWTKIRRSGCVHKKPFVQQTVAEQVETKHLTLDQPNIYF